MRRAFQHIVERKFPAFIALYFLSFLLIRILFSNALEIDEAEQIFLSQKLALGYNQQPPLYTWAIIFLTKVFGNIIFCVTFFRVVLLIGIFYLVYWITKETAKEKLIIPVVASLSMLLFLQLSIESIRQTHTVLVTFAVALLFYAFIRLSKHPTYPNYLFFGFAMALGIYAKYNFTIALVALLVSACLNHEYKHLVLNKKTLSSLCVFFLLVGAHLAWLYKNLAMAEGDTIKDLQPEANPIYLTAIFSTWTFIKGNLSFSGIFLASVILLFKGKTKFLFCRDQNGFLKLLGYFLIFSTVILMAIIVLTKATNTHERWVQPFLFLLPVYVFVKASLYEFPKKLFQQFSIVLVSLSALIVCYVAFGLIFGPTLGFAERINRPYDTFAGYLTKDNSIALADTDLIVCDALDLAGNLKFQLPKNNVNILEAGKLFFEAPQKEQPHRIIMVTTKSNYTGFFNSAKTAFNGQAFSRPKEVELFFNRSHTLTYKFYVSILDPA